MLQPVHCIYPATTFNLPYFSLVALCRSAPTARSPMESARLYLGYDPRPFAGSPLPLLAVEAGVRHLVYAPLLVEHTASMACSSPPCTIVLCGVPCFSRNTACWFGFVLKAASISNAARTNSSNDGGSGTVDNRTECMLA